jgi:hypothetical protein
MLLDWKKLVWYSEAELAGLDIAAVNLACAAGLPSSERIDYDLCLSRLDYWARAVGQYTQRLMPQFRRKRYDYENSEAFFRSLCLITVLQRDMGVQYNPLKKGEDVPFDTEDSFIHGILQGPGGICATMAVVYLAVGRRLGYPLRLAAAMSIERKAGHLFARWDDPRGERVNIEAAGRGMSSPLDDYYRTGRYAVTAELERKACLVRSMTPKEELAAFLSERGHRWLDLRNYRQAVESFAWSSALQPENRATWNTLVKHLDEWHQQLEQLKPRNFSQLSLTWPVRRFADTLPLDIERDILGLEATENLLTDPALEKRWWSSLRRGEWVSGAPSMALIRYTPERCEVVFDRAW